MKKKLGIPGKQRFRALLAAAAGVLVLAGFLAGGTVLMSRSAHRDASDAARSVSLLYLEELAGRHVLLAEDVDVNAEIMVMCSAACRRV